MERQTKHNNDELSIDGRKILFIRDMTSDEAKEEGWTMLGSIKPQVLILDNNTKLFASCDAEGNGPGMLFGRTKNGAAFRIG